MYGRPLKVDIDLSRRRSRASRAHRLPEEMRAGRTFGGISRLEIVGVGEIFGCGQVRYRERRVAVVAELSLLAIDRKLAKKKEQTYRIHAHARRLILRVAQLKLCVVKVGGIGYRSFDNDIAWGRVASLSVFHVEGRRNRPTTVAEGVLYASLATDVCQLTMRTHHDEIWFWVVNRNSRIQKLDLSHRIQR